MAIAVDDGQQVIEIVRHAAGQFAHRVELLRVSQTFFQARAVFGLLRQ